jgi:matrixin
MSQAPPPLDLPPLHLPPRPDQGKRSAPLFVAFVLSFLVAIVLVVLAVLSFLKDPADVRDLAAASSATPSSIPAATTTPSPALSPTAPTFRPKSDGAFRFLEQVGGVPVRWNPCDPVTYAVNAAGVTSPVRHDLKEALRRVTRATGIGFRSVGTTSETFIRAYQRMRYEGVVRKAELILIWVDHEGYTKILRLLRDPRPSIAFAKTMAGLFANQDQYFGGIIVMDADATATPGFGYRYAHGSVLLHELGHIMGLDHVRDPDQLMYSGRRPNFSVSLFGAGDLEGLRQLGEDAGCLD